MLINRIYQTCSMPTSQTPAAAGFIMPPEWAQHERCWMAWPRRAAAHRGFMKEARAAYAAVAHAIMEFEPLTMVVHPEDEKAARQMLAADVEIMPECIDDAWMRDSGPTFLINTAGELGGADWQFNAWGEKFPPWQNDNAIAGKILESTSARCFAAPFVLEGGSFHVNGGGVLMTTEQCLLHKNRNPNLNQTQIEKHLREYLGVQKIIWLAGDVSDYDTDGHVDNIACFADENTVLYVSDNVTDKADSLRAENVRRLQSAANANGKKFNLYPLPRPQIIERGEDLVASYVNFYIANGGIVMPSFDMREDAAAKDIIADAFPNRVVRQVPALNIIRGGGGIHCITQQQPRAGLA